MNKQMIEIIVEEVKRNYKTESVFYEKTLGITQQSWNRFKRGERGLKEDKLSMIRALFTPYEWMLANKVASDMSTYSKIFKNGPFETYIDVKKSIASAWADRASISVNSAINVDDPSLGRINPGTAVTVSISYENGLFNKSDTIILYTDQSSAHIPAGKKNRLKWFTENVDQLK